MTFTDQEKVTLPNAAGKGGMSEPHLNKFQGAALIVGAMIGSGIFTNPGKVFGLIGSTLPSLLLWIFGALVASVASLNYAELGSRITQSGGDAPFLDAAFTKPHRFMAIMYSWTRVVLINPGYCSSLGYLVGQYLTDAFPDALGSAESTKRWIGTIVLLVQTLACVPSNKTAGKFLTYVAAMSVLMLALFSGTGMAVLVGAAPKVRNLENFSADHLFAGTVTNPGTWASALFKVLWAYDGFANLASSLSELRNPEKNIKKATVMGISTVAVLYLFANLSYLVVLSYTDLSTLAEGVAAQWASNLFGKTGTTIVTAAIALVVFACSYVSLFSASRVAQAQGESGLMFPSSVFSAVHSRTGTPLNALVFNLVLSLALVWGPPDGDVFWTIITLVSYPLWVWYGMTALALFVLKRRGPAPEGAVVVPMIAPLFVMAVSLFLSIFPYFDPDQVLPSALSWAFVAAGVVPYYLLQRGSRVSGTTA
ncbi:amino acid/polyamine transporter I [Blastocladiella britannica]|nr:amino acid/polyamine transporter I [Blastocladiella britannica]